jgi:hypothetical protein
MTLSIVMASVTGAVIIIATIFLASSWIRENVGDGHLEEVGGKALFGKVGGEDDASSFVSHDGMSPNLSHKVSDFSSSQSTTYSVDE